MASSGSLDANVLLRLLLNDVPQQHMEAIELFESASGQFDISDIAIIEMAFVLCRHYEFTRAAVVEAVEGLMAIPKINCNRYLFEKALATFAKYPKLSLEDCCLVAYAEQNKAIPLWTFDKKLANQTPNSQIVGQSRP